MITAIILQIILIFLNAVFASAEIAVISTNENKLEKLAEAGDKRAGRLIKLTSRPGEVSLHHPGGNHARGPARERFRRG